jgi:hypothetical protein
MNGILAHPRVRIALAALVVAGMLMISALRGALEIAPLPAARPTPAAAAPPTAPARAEYPIEYLMVAVGRDPFSPQRRPSAIYFPPGTEPVAPAAPVSTAPPLPETFAPPPQFRLVGTMLAPGGRAVALLEGAGLPARIVRVGERIGDHTLTLVEPGRAVLRSPDGDRLELKLSQPGT